jgi:hypothetical protein
MRSALVAASKGVAGAAAGELIPRATGWRPELLLEGELGSGGFADTRDLRVAPEVRRRTGGDGDRGSGARVTRLRKKTKRVVSLSTIECVWEIMRNVILTWRWHLGVNFRCSAFSNSANLANRCSAFCTQF